MKVSREDIINLTKTCIPFQTMVIISSDKHFYEQLLKNINEQFIKNNEKTEPPHIFVINTSDNFLPPFYENFTLTHGSILSPKEIHDGFCAFENKWHELSCGICKSLVNIKNKIPKQIDTLIVDTNDFISYFEYKKIIEQSNCKQQYFVESKNKISLFNNYE